MSWFEALPAVFVGTIVLAVAGAPIAFALGLRGRIAVAVSPVFAISVIVVAAFVTAFVPGSFGVPLVLGTTLALTLLAFGVRQGAERVFPTAAERRGSEPPAPRAVRLSRIAFVVAFAGAFVVISARFASIIGEPSNISQTFDNIYHLNAVRYLLETGDASPLTFSSSTYAFNGQGSFYPAAWHAFTGLVALVSGASVPVATTAANILIGGVIWPLGVLLVSHVLFGARIVATLATGVLASALGAFPYLMIDFGVLYPNLLSIAVLPATFALGLLACGLGQGGQVDAVRAWLAFAATLPALAIAHPSTLIALVIIATPPVLVAGSRRAAALWRDRHGGALAGHLAMLSAAALIGFVLIWQARPTYEAAFWRPQLELGEALYSALTLSTNDTAPNLVYAALTVAGTVALIVWKRHRWLIASHAILCALWVIALWAPFGALRYVFVGTWYSDENRLEALIPVTGVPLAAVGVVGIIDAVARLIRRAPSDADDTPTAQPDRAAVLVGGAVLLAVLAGTQAGPALNLRVSEAQREYALTDESLLLSTDEAALLDRADEVIPEDGVVIGSPWTGTSLVWAYAERLALLPAIYGDRTPDTLLLLDSLREAEPGSAECEAIEREGVTHVLDFGRQEVHDGRNVFRGIERLSTSDAVELVDSEGDAKLYAVTACAN